MTLRQKIGKQLAKEGFTQIPVRQTPSRDVAKALQEAAERRESQRLKRLQKGNPS